MMLARVIGNVVSTVKDPKLEGRKLLLIQPLSRDGNPKGRPMVGIDCVGAGAHETVYWCRGKEASLAFTAEVPSDCSIVGIVDTITRPQRAPNGTPTAPRRPHNLPSNEVRHGGASSGRTRPNSRRHK